MKKILLLFPMLFIAFAGRGLACSCAVSRTVDIEFAKASNVIVAKVFSANFNPKSLFDPAEIGTAVLTVEKSFKGNLKVGQKLTFVHGTGMNCTWVFAEEHIGREYLLYLGPKPEKNGWIASICSRSGQVDWVSADLSYLENMEKFAGRSRLSGRVTKSEADSVEERYYNSQPLSDRAVSITGSGKTIKLKTDRNGVYQIYDLPPGKYKVRSEPIEGFGDPDDTEGIDAEVKAKTHTERNMDFRIYNVLSGTFLDTNGKPLKDVCMRLVGTKSTAHPKQFKFDCTDEDGYFEIKEIPSGNYFLLLNDDNKITARTPFGAFYYPKASKREDAAELQFGPGTVIEDLLVVAPTTAEVITVSGTLRLKDGKTANEENAQYAGIEFVAFDDPNVTAYDPSSRAWIDEAGRFTIRILKGQKGKLYGTMSAYSGKYVNCPDLEKLIKGNGSTDVKTPFVLIDAEADQTGVELVFPFPTCKKAKID